MDYIAKKEIEEKGYENILKDFVNNIHTEYCYDWDGLNSDIILPCIEQALSEIERLNNIIDKAIDFITSHESIEIMQQTEHSENNKGFDEKTIIEMTRRYIIAHNKLLDILKEKE